MRLSDCSSWVDRRFKLNNRSQRFIGPHNETISVAVTCISDKDRSPVGIRG